MITAHHPTDGDHAIRERSQGLPLGAVRGVDPDRERDGVPLRLSWETAALPGTSLVLLGLAVVVESRAAEPVVPLDIGPTPAAR